MSEGEWLLQEAKRLADDSQTYEDVAFYTQLAVFLDEQDRRIDQAQGELDGILWDHEGW
ncbi:hypothetical protein [Lacticaseibacillus porcinae]|uniref:hypothetical protein n=1 Tax=Lacticaseibacillus porcinae TaxID=1123687 RepID=UPI0013DDDA1B|nr:hypothetical protein [Lacticaseibacillus porcinae]